MVDVDSTPLLDGPMVYAVAYQGNLRGVRRQDGNPLWELPMSSFLDLDTGYGQLYVVDEEDTIIAVDTRTAEEAWRQDESAENLLKGAAWNAVQIADEGGEGRVAIDVTAEVAQHLGENRARCIAMEPTDGIVRGMPAEDLGQPITVPVGEPGIRSTPCSMDGLRRVRQGISSSSRR